MNQINLAHSQPHDECFRCGYDLFGVLDDNPCPECGLLADRSRHKSEELHDSHPRWLRNMRRGLILLVLAMISILVWPYLFFGMFVTLESLSHVNRAFRHSGLATWISQNADDFTPIFVLGPSVLLLTSGIFLLTRPEGYPVADQADHKRRRAMRILAITALATLLLSVPLLLAHGSDDRVNRLQLIVASLIGVEISPLFLLLFLQLRSIAARMGRKFNRHDLLVGGLVGVVAMFLGSATELTHAISDYIGPVGPLLGSADGSIVAVVTIICLLSSAISFYCWCIYILMKFILAFGKASSELRRRWAIYDLSRSYNNAKFN